MSTPELSVESAVATITLRRPEQANRLEPEDLETLLAHLDTVNADPTILVLCLRATGKYFCSGYNIGAIGGARRVDFEQVANALEQARPVTVAVLQGGVYGGATDLALACDFRLGGQATDMFMPAVRLGLHFYRGGLERYVTRLGLDNAKRLFLTADRLGAEELLRIGFLTELCAGDALESRADQLCDTLAGQAPMALLGMKNHLNHIARGTLDAQALQQDVQRAFQSEDLREGQAAWLEKRPPRFSGR
ncbi:3-hydroxybutyryl-CoA dehydratase [Alcanivorax sp. N3-2A]|nr:3-hydroxybutyryl-CoA dehydratase [Alcanivorax sp. N3-2A]|tara:strand:- start:5889 stop:6635 length:747 start_codon:yes stop_codon:yes gene_type:complete